MMYSFLHGLLSDKKGGKIFTLFGLWHFFYILLTLSAVISVLILLKGKRQSIKEKVTKGLISAAFYLYVADFFLMPLAYGEIDIEKLPFHACTAMCVMCFLSFRINFLEKYRRSFAMLGLISNFVYLVYPAGVMWHAVHPLSYRVIQTLIFHGLMTVACFLTVVYERGRLNIRESYRELTVVVGMTLWAILGNYTYNGTSEGYSHFFNWFFVVCDPFGIFPEAVAPFVMPFLNIVLFFALEMLIYLIGWCVKRMRK